MKTAKPTPEKGTMTWAVAKRPETTLRKSLHRDLWDALVAASDSGNALLVAWLSDKPEEQKHQVSNLRSNFSKRARPKHLRTYRTVEGLMVWIQDTEG